MRIHAGNSRKRENKTRPILALDMDGYDRCCCETSATAMISMPLRDKDGGVEGKRYAETSCKKIDVVHVVKISSVGYGEWRIRVYCDLPLNVKRPLS